MDSELIGLVVMLGLIFLTFIIAVVIIAKANAKLTVVTKIQNNEGETKWIDKY